MGGYGEKVGRNTVKAFLRKNAGKVLPKVSRRFDAMVDGCEPTGQVEFKLAAPAERPDPAYNMGLEGVWFVGGGRDHITRWAEGDLVGFYVFNSCGSFTLAVANS